MRFKSRQQAAHTCIVLACVGAIVYVQKQLKMQAGGREKKIESNLHNCRALPICLFSRRLALGEKTKQEREGK
jgi:hypothetical protein